MDADEKGALQTGGLISGKNGHQDGEPKPQLGLGSTKPHRLITRANGFCVKAETYRWQLPEVWQAFDDQTRCESLHG